MKLVTNWKLCWIWRKSKEKQLKKKSDHVVLLVINLIFLCICFTGLLLYLEKPEIWQFMQKKILKPRIWEIKKKTLAEFFRRALNLSQLESFSVPILALWCLLELYPSIGTSDAWMSPIYALPVSTKPWWSP